MNRRDFNRSTLVAAGGWIMNTRQASTALKVNGDRINEHLKALSAFGRNAGRMAIAGTRDSLWPRL